MALVLQGVQNVVRKNTSLRILSIGLKDWKCQDQKTLNQLGSLLMLVQNLKELEVNLSE